MTTGTRPLGVDTSKPFLYWSPHHNLPVVLWRKQRLMRLKEGTEKRVGFSQKFALIIPTPTGSLGQSCCKGNVAFLWFKNKAGNAERCWAGSSEVIFEVSSCSSCCWSRSPLWLMNWLAVCWSHCPASLSHLLLSSLLFPCSLSILSSFVSYLPFSLPLLSRPPLLSLCPSNVSLLETNARFNALVCTDLPLLTATLHHPLPKQTSCSCPNPPPTTVNCAWSAPSYLR